MPANPRGALRWSLLSLAAFAAGVPSAARAQNVFVADAMRKIRANEPSVPTATSASIKAAKNEFEAFQIVVQGPASNVTATATSLTGPGGATISAASCNAAGNIRLYREALYWVDATKMSDVHSMTGWVPDALVPQVDEFDNQCRNFSFSVPSGEYRVIWVDVLVPQSAPAGLYVGSVTVSWSGGSRNVPVTLEVWDFALPSTASLRSHFAYPYNALSIQHGTPYCTAGLMTLLQRYAVLALDHRMSFTKLDDGCSYTDVAGAYTTNFGSLMDGTAGTRLPGARATGIIYLGDETISTTLTAWKNHFRSRGWFDRMFEYTADEPPYIEPWSIIGPRARLAHSVDPQFRTLVVTSIERAQAAAPSNGFSVDDINIFVPNIDQLEPAPSGNTRSSYDAWLGGNGINEVWQYQSCESHGCGGTAPAGSNPGASYYPKWPSYAIDATLMRARALEWFSFKNGLAGELYYSTADAFYSTSPGPWVDQWQYTGHGDGTLFYPGTPAQIGGTTHVPVASMRMRMIREGMEDYEYMHLLESQGQRQFALDQLATVFGPASDADRNPTNLYAARDQMACRILTNQGKPCTGTQPTLALSKAGTGSGTVTSTPAGISCGTTCSSQSAPFMPGTTVTLTAAPASGSTFGGFSGACASAGTSCTFTINASSSIIATFNGSSPCAVDDCFSRADGALGASWNVFAPGIAVISGQAGSTTTGSKGAQFLENVGVDQDLSAKCKVTSSGSNCALLSRFNDANNYYYAYLDAGLSQVALWRKSGGTPTQLGSASRTIATNTYYPLRLLVQGSALKVYFNGEATPAVSVTDTGIMTGNTGGIHGYAGGTNTVQWDDFNVVAASASPTFTSSATASPASVAPGGTSTLTATVTNTSSTALANGIIDIEVYDAAGTQISQWACTGVNVAAGTSANCAFSWTAPSVAGAYTIKVGVFGPSWAPLYHWNNGAGSVTVAAASANPTFSSSATASPASVSPGGTSTIAATVINTSSTALANGIIDVEVYDTAGTQISQWACSGVNVAAGASASCSFSWTAPSAAGAYTIKVGVFGAGWAPLYHWNNGAGSVTVAPASANPTFSSSATATPASVPPGATSTITGNVTNTSTTPLSNGIIDVEVYDAAGTQISQWACSGMNVAAGASASCSFPWTAPSAAGTYVVKVGVFGAGWAPLYHWNSAAGSVSVTGGGSGGPTSRVTGSRLYDACGQELILRGVNKMSVWTDPFGNTFPEIARTQANTVRIVWDRSGSVADLDRLIARALSNQMVPMVELHDASGDWSLLPAVVDWWVRSDVVAVVRKYERTLLVNIANEAGDQVSPNDFVNGYRDAISRMRGAGFRTPLVVDAPGWGQDIGTLGAAARTLQDFDPDHNLVFSVHIYWEPSRNVGAELQGFVDGTGQPLIVGEFSTATVGCAAVVDYRVVMAEAQRLRLGWYAWEWGPGNSNCWMMDMTTDGTFGTLWGWAAEVALTDPNSIRNTARPSLAVRSATCTP